MVPGERYYREQYRDYDRQNSARKIGFYMRLVRRWARPHARVHEIGTGLGAFLAEATREFQCSGSEVNEYGLEMTRRRAGGADLSHGSYERIPHSPGPDVVVAWDVLEHMPDLDRALDCVKTRLPPGGLLMAVVPVYDGPLGPVVRWLDRDPTHVWKWPRSRWIQTLTDHGFELVETGGVVRYLVAGRWYLHLTRPAGLWRQIGSAFWFVARRPTVTVDGKDSAVVS